MARGEEVSSAADTVRTERDRFVAFAFAAADIVLELYPDGCIRFAAGATSALAPPKGGKFEGLTFESLVVEEDRGVARRILAEAGQHRMDPVILTMSGAGGRPLRCVMSGYRIADFGNHFFISLSVARANAAATQAASNIKRDEESGLADADSFSELAAEVLKAGREGGGSSELTFLTLPDFEAFRGRVGEDVRRRLAQQIGEQLRAKAVDGMTAGRLGDGRYGFVHRAGLDLAGLEEEIAETTRALDPEKRGMAVSASTLDLASGSLDEDGAIRALTYTIKKYMTSRDGTLSVQSLSDSYEGMLNDAVERIANFREMVGSRAFRVAFQPIVSLETGAVHHYEALARFADDVDSPFETIAFAEETGMIGEFDLMMCQRVLEILGELGPDDAPEVAVNLSGRSLSSTVFMDALEAVLERNPALRSRLLFEVTESAEIADLSDSNAAIQRLRRSGHEVCLDDFGAGAAAFSYLRELTVDYVKIDGAYVRDALDDKQIRAFLKAMNGLCRDLGIETVAEWVENEATASFLMSQGVQFGQGYYFGRPVFDLAPARKPAPESAPPQPKKAKSKAKPKPETTTPPAPSSVRRRGFRETWG